MTGREFSGADNGPTGLGLSTRDLDLLADFVGGALAGTPAEGEVARRIQDDPAWRRAHATLAEATTAVAADLGAWGGAPEPMPDEVGERISAALSTAGAPDAGRATTRGGLSVVRGGSVARPQRRWTRRAGQLAAAAAVLAVCGLGLRVLPEFSADSSDAGSSETGADMFGAEGDAPAAGPAAPGERAMSGLQVRRLLASGTNYSWSTLRGPLTSADKPSVSASASAGAGDDADRWTGQQALEADAVDPALRRLTAPDALASCLTAIGMEHSSAPTAIELVDYAAFEGSPALVVIFTDNDAHRVAWVAGPRCGLATAGADTRYRANVG